ncbi:hypothetical protein [Actinomyces qiguomingii]|uniref:hypothetical protein n=1 Tax=Actinomyces qiguomingii TaxID=2057800 RepID=UPI00157FBB6F|nr:hypothetical protein [Actinomyces qiguomingii]
MIVSGEVSYDVVVSVPGGSGGGGVTVEGGTGGVFDERAAFMASLSYAMCFGMRMGVNVGMRAVVLDPDECATDAAAATSVQASDGTTVVVKVTAANVSTLLAEGSGITRQPPGPEVLLTKDFIVYTSPDTQVLTTTVAGTEVTIHATPTSYTWNWGDGTTTTTTDPGAPWPNQTLTHRYTRTATDVTTTLTTTWKATYTPNGGTTTPVVVICFSVRVRFWAEDQTAWVGSS